MGAALAAALAAGVAARPLGAQATVHGRVSDAETGRPIAGAVVELAGGPAARVDTSDAWGGYAFAALPAATYDLRVAHATHATRALRVVVGSAREITVDVPLPPARPPVPLPRVVVRGAPDGAAGRAGAVPAAGGEAEELAPWRALAGAAPGARGSLADATALSPAAREAPGGALARPAHLLYVWGAGDERGRVVVDGAPLDAPLHVAGLLPPLDGAVLARGTVRAAGASPRHDGGADYIVEYETRAPRGDAVRAWGELDPLASRLGVELPVGGGALWASARHVHGGLAERLTGRPFGYAYDDAVARGDFPVAGGTARATAIATAEAVTVPRDQGRDHASWRNVAGALAWTGGDATRRHAVRATVGQGAVALPLLALAAGRTRTTADRATLFAERVRRRGAWTEALGADAGLLRLTERSAGVPGPVALPVAAPAGAAAECLTPGACWSASAATGGAFGEWARAAGARARLGVGARANVTGARGGGVVRLLPRASLAADVGHGTVVGVSVGRYSQLVAVARRAAPAPPEPGTDSVRRPPAPVPAPVLAPVHGVQAELGAAWRRAGVTATAVASVRRTERAAGAPPALVPGLDLSWRSTTARTVAAVEYAARFTAHAPRDDARRSAPAPDRHVLSGRIAAPAAGALRVELSATYAVGLPFTSVVLEHPTPIQVMGTETDPVEAPATRPLLRLDAAVRGRWRLTSGGRTLTLEPHVAVRNALDRRDAPFYYRSAAPGSRARALAALPLLATIGVRWEAAIQRTSTP